MFTLHENIMRIYKLHIFGIKDIKKLSKENSKNEDLWNTQPMAIMVLAL